MTTTLKIASVLIFGCINGVGAILFNGFDFALWLIAVSLIQFTLLDYIAARGGGNP